MRSVRVSVGTHNDRPDLARMSLVPFIDTNAIVTDQRLQTVSFPLYMPISCRECDSYKLTIKQPARTCDRTTYHHTMCFDITCKDCI